MYRTQSNHEQDYNMKINDSAMSLTFFRPCFVSLLAIETADTFAYAQHMHGIVRLNCFVLIALAKVHTFTIAFDGAVNRKNQNQSNPIQFIACRYHILNIICCDYYSQTI